MHPSKIPHGVAVAMGLFIFVPKVRSPLASKLFYCPITLPTYEWIITWGTIKARGEVERVALPDRSITFGGGSQPYFLAELLNTNPICAGTAHVLDSVHYMPTGNSVRS